MSTRIGRSIRRIAFLSQRALSLTFVSEWRERLQCGGGSERSSSLER